MLSRTTGDLHKFAPDRPLDQAPAWAASVLAAGFNAAEDMTYALRADGTPCLAVADTGSHRIIGVSLANGARFAIAGAQGQSDHVDGPGLTARFDGPTAIAQRSDGTLVVVDQEGTALRTIAPDGTVATLGHGNDGPLGLGNVDGRGDAARFFAPQGIVVDSHGNAFVANTPTHTLRRIAPDGSVTTVAGTPNRSGATDGDGPSQALLELPENLAIDKNDRVYIAVTPQGDLVFTAGNAVYQITAPEP